MKDKIIAYLKKNWKHLFLVAAAGVVHLLGNAGVIDHHQSNEISGALGSLGVILIGTSGTQGAIDETKNTNQPPTQK